MITFIQLGSLGRLGNQFFQYAALYSLAKHKGYEFCIPNPEDRTHHGQKCLLGEFNITAQINSSIVPELHYTEPDPWKYDSNFFSIPDDVNLSGFFQSTWYFGDKTEEIKNELTPKKQHLEKAKEWKSSLPKNKTIVSLHLRRGDNCDNTDGETAKQTSYGSSNKLDPNSFMGKYINNAIKQFDEDSLFVIFTGGSRNGNNEKDIEWCKNNFSENNFTIASSSDELSDFCKIMSCDHNIISPISSFGWWAAFLNKNPNKKVIAPKQYHPGVEINHRPMFYPKEFTLI
tara:strand:+ start:4979 stop:5839 length:861 start_codon:yes stop_codon:yes gene_type:complete